MNNKIDDFRDPLPTVRKNLKSYLEEDLYRPQTDIQERYSMKEDGLVYRNRN